jgi:type IV pilus assembly protein PilA
MTIQLKKNAAGFTLIELMIVVAIIGVLAALAIYGVSQYLRHSKTAEARTNLASIWKGNESKYNADTPNSTGTIQMYCVSAHKSIPNGGVPSASKLAPDGTEYSADQTADPAGNTGWPCLKFQIAGGLYYQYTYTSACTTATCTPAASMYTATAQGNLSGAGTGAAWFTLTGGVSSGVAGHSTVAVANEDM